MPNTGHRPTRRLAFGLAIAIPLAVVAMPAAGQEFTMKFATATVNEVQHEFIKFYKEAVERLSKGRIKVDIYPRGELGPIPRMIDGLQLGTVEAFIAPTDFFVGVDPRYGVFSAPFLFRDPENASATVQDPAINEHILNLADGKGMVGLGITGFGAVHYAARNPLLSLTDFRGKKLRVNATDMERERMRRLGATAVPLPLNEVLPSLQRGVIDGTMSAIPIFVTFKFRDVVDVVTVTNDTMLVSIGMVSKAWLDKLPPDLRKAVLDAGREAQTKTNKWAHQFIKEQEQAWLKMGGKLHVLPKEDLAKLSELIKSVGDDVSKKQPPVHELLQKVRAIAAKH